MQSAGAGLKPAHVQQKGNMDTKTFDTFRRIFYDTAGININDNKLALVSARVGKRMRELGHTSDRDYLKFLIDDSTGEEMVHLLDVISTNVTHFFRESRHFDVLTAVVKEWVSLGLRKIKVWSAGCSSGEEPYTLAMVLREAIGERGVEARILATDLSTRILQKAAAGEYDERKTADMPAVYRDRYFDKQGRGDSAVYRASEGLREMIRFTRLNLSTVPFPMQGPFDVIFCRNVMIYFDNDVRARLLGEFARLLKPEGYLFVGHAESLTGMLSGFRSVEPSVYVKGGALLKPRHEKEHDTCTHSVAS